MQPSTLHVIIDVTPGGVDAVALTQLVLSGGAAFIQVRPKGVTDRHALDTTGEIVALCHAAGARCIVNDRADLALATDADGCHVGADDLPVAVMRQLLGATAIVGGTARGPELAIAHEQNGASYVGVGPIYATSSKTGLPDPLGPSVLTAVATAVGIPVIAISGVTLERVPELMAAGASGVAVIGAISRAPDPAAATAAFVAALDRYAVRR